MTAMTPHSYPIAVPKQGSVALAKWQPFTAPAVRQSLGDSATGQPSEPGQVVRSRNQGCEWDGMPLM